MRVTKIFAESARNKAATDQNSPTTVAAHNDLKRSQDRDSSMALENTKEKEVTAEKYITLNDGDTIILLLVTIPSTYKIVRKPTSRYLKPPCYCSMYYEVNLKTIYIR